jgi:O-antigen ligase
MVRIPQLLYLLTTTLACLSIFISFLYPLHLPPWRTFAAELFCAVSILLGLIAVGISRAGLQVKFSAVTFGLFALATAVGQLHPSHPSETIWWAIYALFSWFAYILGSNSKQSDAIAPIITIILAVTIASSLSIVQRYGVAQIPGFLDSFFYVESAGARVFTSIGQPNRFGVLATVATFLSLWVYLRIDHVFLRLGLSLCIIILAQGVVLSQSRVALIGLVLASTVLLTSYCVRSDRPRISVWLLTAAPLIIYLISSPLHATFLGLESRTIAISHEVSYSDPQRLRMWALGLQSLTQSPWIGHGLGATPALALANSPIYGSFEYKILTHFHNIPLDFLVEHGVLVGSAVVIFFYGFWARVVKDSLHTQQALIVCATIPIFFHSLLEYPLYYGYFLWLLFWILGFCSARTSVQLEPTLKLSRKAVLWLVSLVTVGSIAAYKEYLQVERMYSLARADRMDEARVASTEPSLIQTVLYGHLIERLSWLVTDIGPDSRMTPEQIADLESAARAYPQYLLVWRSAVANAANGNPERAAWWAERLCHMFEPQSCQAAKDLWESVERPGWPKLNWDNWLEPSSPRPGQGMVRSR